MSKPVAVVGWYGQKNLGDEAFKGAFQELWPHHEFHFFDAVPSEVNEHYSAVMVGGGSVLDEPIPGIERISIPTAFIGVGVGSSIHPKMLTALQRARIVIARNPEAVLRSDVPVQIEIAPDLVFARQWPDQFKRNPIQVTILLNDHFVPKIGGPDWSLLSHSWFTHEFAKACDHLAYQGLSLVFCPMSTNPSYDDRRAAAHILSRMKLRHRPKWVVAEYFSESDLLGAIASSSLVISQRLHGCIFSAIAGVPYLAIDGHEKMTALNKVLEWNGNVPYYGFTMAHFLRGVEWALENTPNRNYCERAVERWRELSLLVDRKLFA